MFPNITSMKPPATREEFEERVNLARELLIIGKMHPQGMDGMVNVRFCQMAGLTCSVLMSLPD